MYVSRKIGFLNFERPFANGKYRAAWAYGGEGKVCQADPNLTGILAASTVPLCVGLPKRLLGSCICQHLLAHESQPDILGLSQMAPYSFFYNALVLTRALIKRNAP